MRYFADKIVYDKYEPKNTNVVWVQPTEEGAQIKAYIDGEWQLIGYDHDAYRKPASGIPESDLEESVRNAIDNAQHLNDKIDDEIERSEGVDASLNERLGIVEQLADISISGGDATIATASDFNNPTAAQKAYIPTVGAILDGADTTPTSGSGKLVTSGGVYNVINSLKSAGYVFVGVATPSTSPGTPTEKVFYIGGAGTYANFGTSVTVPVGSICVFKYNGSWTKEILSDGLLDELNQLSYKLVGIYETGQSQTTNTTLISTIIKSGDVVQLKVSTSGTFSRVIVNYNGSNDPGYRIYDSSYHDNTIPDGWFDFTAPVDINYFGLYLSSSSSPFTLEVKYTGEIEKLYNAIEVVSDELDDTENIVLENVISKNLLNPSDIELGKYMSSTIHENVNYMLSGVISVKPNTMYCFSDNTIRVAPRFVTELKSDGTYNKYSEYVYNITTDANTKYIRVTFNISFQGEQLQVEEGELPTNYIPYFNNYQQTKVTNGSLFAIGRNQFRGLFKDGTINNNEYLICETLHISKNTIVSTHIDGTFTDICVGLGYLDSSTEGYRDYSSRWIEITSTQLMEYTHTHGADVLVKTEQHGLTIGEQTSISIITDNNINGKGKVIITTNLGDVYTTEITGIGIGAAFIQNKSSISIYAQLSFFPMDINQPIWAFGDSYFSYISSDRWPYYLLEQGYKNYLLCHQPGINAVEMLPELELLLEIADKPSMIIWCIGMNGGNDVDGVINWQQKEYIDIVSRICNERGITLVLATVPSVPARARNGFNSYIKSLGVRYIDFSKAVGADISNTWYNGLLEPNSTPANRVHPTELGAKVLASQAFVDCPELFTSK